MSGKFDPIFEELVMEQTFEQFGVAPERFIRKIAVMAQEFYYTDEMGVEVSDEYND